MIRFKLLLLICIMSVPVILVAQPPVAQPPDFPEDTNDAELPFDGGVSLLVAAGVAYGLKKANDKRKLEKV